MTRPRALLVAACFWPLATSFAPVAWRGAASSPASATSVARDVPDAAAAPGAAAAAPDARPRAGERFYLSIDYVKAYRAAEEPEVAGPSDAHVGDEAEAPSLLLLPLRSCT